MHTVWMREHNRVADLLFELNPGWNDEILYQESRRLVTAEMQHIVFNEFLPIIIGRNAMRAFGLFLNPNGYGMGYSVETNPGITSAFATAAFRLHTLIEGNIKLLNRNNRVVDSVELKTQFNNPQILYKQRAIDLMINGLTGQPIQHGLSDPIENRHVMDVFLGDNFFTEDVTNHLFEPIGQPFGMDLIALNIQRGMENILFYTLIIATLIRQRSRSSALQQVPRGVWSQTRHQFRRPRVDYESKCRSGHESSLPKR